ncbi:MAG: outer membrane beta-barrel protein [Acidobacteria bacterium]|jgi:OOP family OmpA-OmpF porin|nr:outer membrane beta-barrel protein [Acidobacteriota bacterium]
MGLGSSSEGRWGWLPAACGLAAALAAVAFAGAPAVLAEEEKKDDRGAAAAVPSSDRSQRSGFYVGGSAGFGIYDDHVPANDDGSLSDVNDDDSDFVWKVYGGYSFGSYFALEGGYRDDGSASFDAQSDGSGDSWAGGDVSAEVETDGWFASALGRLPLGDRWSLFAKVGVYGWSTKETFTENGYVSTDEDSGTDISYGLGAEWDPGNPDDVVLRGEVDRTEVDDDQLPDTTVTVGMVWQF